MKLIVTQPSNALVPTLPCLLEFQVLLVMTTSAIRVSADITQLHQVVCILPTLYGMERGAAGQTLAALSIPLHGLLKVFLLLQLKR